MPAEIGLEDIRVLGVMSGTSLDGIDMALCHFNQGAFWQYRVEKAITVKFPSGLKSSLARSMGLRGDELISLDIELGHFIADSILANFEGDFIISSHGHTVYHQPAEGVSLQIGNPGVIGAKCDRPVVADFRIADVHFGGQGAPLVPIGDHHLFSEYRSCLNLGGISNLSFERDGIRSAFDICPVNMSFNFLAGLAGLDMDLDGELARSGHVDQDILNRLAEIDYYKKQGPKSLGKEWFDDEFLKVLLGNQKSIEDLLATSVEHAAIMISKELPAGRCLVTGGGARNKFLLERMTAICEADLHLPADELIDFKEALVFAFMGLLRWLLIPNVLKSVTGANRDHCAGALYLP
jgi:anhydro-N-acetylmuramic acid kinase